MLEPEEPGQGEGVLGDEAGEVDGPHQGRSSPAVDMGVYQ